MSGIILQQWRGGRGARGQWPPLNMGANRDKGGPKSFASKIWLGTSKLIVKHFAVTCCEQSYKTCHSTIKARCIAINQSTFVSDIFMLTMCGLMFSTPTNEDFTSAKNAFY